MRRVGELLLVEECDCLECALARKMKYSVEFKPRAVKDIEAESIIVYRVRHRREAYR